MIDFETPKPIEQINTVVETVAVNMMRPVSRYFDEHEHEIPWDYINFMHQAVKSMGGTSMAPDEGKKKVDSQKKKRPSMRHRFGRRIPNPLRKRTIRFDHTVETGQRQQFARNGRRGTGCSVRFQLGKIRLQTADAGM